MSSMKKSRVTEEVLAKKGREELIDRPSPLGRLGRDGVAETGISMLPIGEVKKLELELGSKQKDRARSVPKKPLAKLLKGHPSLTYEHSGRRLPWK